MTNQRSPQDTAIAVIEQAVLDQQARITWAGDPGQYLRAVAWNAARTAVQELAQQGMLPPTSPGHHVQVTVDPRRNHGRASISRSMVPIWSPAGLLWAGDPVEVIRDEFDLTAAEAVVVAALADDFRDLTEGDDDPAPTEADLRSVYRERAHLVAYLAALFPSVISHSGSSGSLWPVVYVATPAGQLSWHMSIEDLDLFGHVPQVPADDPRARWDGHTTEEKYQRLAALVTEDQQEGRNAV